jgi:hypothetical protein
MTPNAAGILGWRDELRALGARLGRLFNRSEPRDGKRVSTLRAC